MGRVITTNSATLVNKGLEVIEAHLLFDIPFDRIDVVVHPQQMIHSMVEFVDGSTIAQAGPPRMLVPIALGLSWPERLADVDVPVDWTQAQSWDFEPLDDEAFPAVRLARQVGEAGGTYPAVYNAANEVAVDAFHDGHIGFVDIVDTVARVVEEHASGSASGIESGTLSVEDVMRADRWARDEARKVLGLQTGRMTGASLSGVDRDDAGGAALMTVLLYVLGVLFVVLGVGLSIGLHEIGHLVPAKKFGVKVTQYMVGLRPHRVVHAARRDRVRHQGDPARRLHPDDRHVPPAARRQARARCGCRAPAGSPSSPTRPAS